MVSAKIRPFAAFLVAALWGSAWACSDDELAPVGLAKPCSLNSDCKTPLVCVFRLCHAQCKEDRDCGGEQRCVAGYDGKVCQIESEIACENDRSCPGQQVCGADGECRDLCREDTDCTTGQLCANSGECASKDPTKDKIDDDGNIRADPFGEGPPVGLGGQGGEGGQGAGGTGGKGGAGMAGKGGMSGAGGSSAGTGGSGGSGGTFSGGGQGPLSTDECPAPNGPVIEHTSEILSEAATWTGTHRIRGYLRVRSALELAPCAVVGLDSAATIFVEDGGSLRALGDAGKAVTITSSKASPAPGDWANISILESASNDSLFQHTLVAYGGADVLEIESGARVGLSSVYVHDTSGTAITGGMGVTFTSFDDVSVENAGDFPLRIRTGSVPQIDGFTSTGSLFDEIVVISDEAVSTPTKWKNLGLPYRLIRGGQGNTQIRSELQIEAGTTLRMEQGISVATDGSLVTLGESGNPVTFTSAKSTPMGGDWPGIVFDADSASGSLLEHAVIEYAGAKAIDVASGATANLVNTLVRAPSGIGVSLTYGAVVSQFDNVVVEDAGDSAFAVCMDHVGKLGSLSSTGSTRDEVKVLQYPLTMDASWADHGIPYRLVTGSGSTAAIEAELTLEAGVTLRMDPAQGWNVANGGSIKAQGTMQKPIVIRSAASAPAAGAWTRITFASTASTDSSFAWTTISDGSSGTLTINDNQVSVSDLTFDNNATCDVDLNGAGALLDGACTCMYTACP
jgi:hypothetical protein